MKMRDIINIVEIADHDAAITPRLLRKYGSGDCWHLAEALHALTGWKLKAVGWIKDTGFFKMMHGVVEHPSGNFVDIRGVREPTAIFQQYGLENPEVRDADPGYWDMVYRGSAAAAFRVILKSPAHFGLSPDATLTQRVKAILADWPE